jgi:TPR repeat protein
MTMLRAWVPFAALLLWSTSSSADPAPRTNPDKCPDDFACGALAASLAGRDPRDFAGAVRASKRQCDMSPEMGCEAYASMLVFVGPTHGDPPRGLAMLEAQCKKGYQPACSTLAHQYERPSRFSGLTPRPDKALPLREEGCKRGDALECSAVADLYLAGGTGVPKDLVKARAALEKGCSGTDQYASGVCSTLGDKIMKGAFGRPSVKEAYPYLEKSCTTSGHRCDLAFKIARDGAPSEGIASDFPKAKQFAKKSCEHNMNCTDLRSLEPREPAWVRAELTQLCAKGRKDACDPKASPWDSSGRAGKPL